MRTPIKVVLLFAAGVVAALRGLASGGRSSAGTSSVERRDKSFWGWLKSRLWTTAKYFAAFLVLMAVGGFLVAALGIIPIKASSGHWAITRWFLNFSSERSVSTHTLGVKAPKLDEPRFVLKGAGAYETNCKACHGSPAIAQPRVAQHMTPRPPYLPTVLPQWDDAELFYIVKHGIKMTGMPAWPAQQRDDEVWAMVAFLRVLKSLDAEGYRRLVWGDAPPGSEVAPMTDMTGAQSVPPAITENCARCHGLDGAGRGTGAFPILAGQTPEYLARSLLAYARNERHSGVMEPNAAGLDAEEMRQIALYFANLPRPSPPSPSPEDSQSLRRGELIANQGIPERRVPACVSCHGPAPRNPVYPVLAGQYPDYLVLQLELFKQGQRGGTEYAHIMRMVAGRLSQEEMRAVALYYASHSHAGGHANGHSHEHGAR